MQTLDEAFIDHVLQQDFQGKAPVHCRTIHAAMHNCCCHAMLCQRRDSKWIAGLRDWIVQVYGASLKDPAHACLVMELVKGGNLHQRIYDRSAPRLTHLEILQV